MPPYFDFVVAVFDKVVGMCFLAASRTTRKEVHGGIVQHAAGWGDAVGTRCRYQYKLGWVYGIEFVSGVVGRGWHDGKGSREQNRTKRTQCRRNQGPGIQKACSQSMRPKVVGLRN